MGISQYRHTSGFALQEAINTASNWALNQESSESLINVPCLGNAGYMTTPCGPFYLHGLTLIPAWMSNYIHYKRWYEITYPFLNFNGATVEV